MVVQVQGKGRRRPNTCYTENSTIVQQMVWYELLKDAMYGIGDQPVRNSCECKYGRYIRQMFSTNVK